MLLQQYLSATDVFPNKLIGIANKFPQTLSILQIPMHDLTNIKYVRRMIKDATTKMRLMQNSFHYLRIVTSQNPGAKFCIGLNFGRQNSGIKQVVYLQTNAEYMVAVGRPNSPSGCSDFSLTCAVFAEVRERRKAPLSGGGLPASSRLLEPRSREVRAVPWLEGGIRPGGSAEGGACANFRPSFPCAARSSTPSNRARTRCWPTKRSAASSRRSAQALARKWISPSAATTRS